MSDKADKDKKTRQETGREGGKKVARERGADYMRELGRRGGERTRDKHGTKFYQKIGAEGGSVVSSRKGPDFFREIGAAGGQKVRELVEEAKAARLLLEADPEDGDGEE